MGVWQRSDVAPWNNVVENVERAGAIFSNKAVGVGGEGPACEFG